VVVGAGNGSGEVRFRLEVGGQAMTTHALPLSLPGPDAVDLSFRVDPIHSTIRARYVVTRAARWDRRFRWARPLPSRAPGCPTPRSWSV
jgi:hypothetical protein